MGGRGGLAICGGVGGWRKRWCDDDGSVVGDRRPRETAPPFDVAHRTVLPYPSSPACDWNGDTNGASATPPTAPNPHITPVQTHGAEVDALANFRSGI